MKPEPGIARLIEIMTALRAPDTGCPWDVEQTFETIAPYTIEEAYEVADAVARGDMDELKDELGDLLLQVVFHARMAEEIGEFAFGDVCRAIIDKLIRRHPHVFGTSAAMDTTAVRQSWEEIKAEERAARGADGTEARSVLDGVPVALPALVRAIKLQKRAARVGFDWDNADSVADKVREEMSELEAASENGVPGAVAEEIGDLLFAVANLARHQGVDPESALRTANDKFVRRFHYIENAASAAELELADVGLERMEAWWRDAKAVERER